MWLDKDSCRGSSACRVFPSALIRPLRRHPGFLAKRHNRRWDLALDYSNALDDDDDELDEEDFFFLSTSTAARPRDNATRHV